MKKACKEDQEVAFKDNKKGNIAILKVPYQGKRET